MTDLAILSAVRQLYYETRPSTQPYDVAATTAPFTAPPALFDAYEALLERQSRGVLMVPKGFPIEALPVKGAPMFRGE